MPNQMDEYPIKWITDYLSVGYAPRSILQLQSVCSAGVGAILNLCAECYDFHESERMNNLNVFHVPIVDEEAPTMAQANEIVKWIDLQRMSEVKVLVHCRFGIGRTGTVVLIYLLHCGVGFKAAQELMEHTPSWPSTNVQKSFVDRYIADVLGAKKHGISKQKEKGLIGKFFSRWEEISKWSD